METQAITLPSDALFFFRMSSQEGITGSIAAFIWKQAEEGNVWNVLEQDGKMVGVVGFSPKTLKKGGEQQV